ncbi:hypothetical protein [Tessaracoccus palaemonis]|uniref:Single-stranded DNA-binding protein n=1 Tax=Tessaracoccus palaemonis TaxID=2829499 RepID=A0ABX8SHK3_9ACTN|nr:hypothetical protein [Tessaracoccus palaemonis]QXT62738.1 hypothetical protein KDB89_13545 [Tessaracoccus palaemonis]
MTNQSTANDVLMGGSGAPAVKLTEGVTISGRITFISDPYQEREYDQNNPGNGAPKFFKSGDPIMTFYVDLATDQRDPSIEDDDGTRRLYMDGARIKKAVRSAVQAARATGLNPGSTLTISCIGYETPGDLRSGKIYQANYTPGNAASNVLMGTTVTGAQAPAPSFAQPPQPAYQPPAPQPTYVPPAPQPTQQAPAATAPQFTPEQLAAFAAAGIPTSAIPGLQG